LVCFCIIRYSFEAINVESVNLVALAPKCKHDSVAKNSSSTVSSRETLEFEELVAVIGFCKTVGILGMVAMEYMEKIPLEETGTNFDFDYETLPFQQRVSVQSVATEIKEHLRHTAQIIWRIGEKLVQVRSQLENRQFNTWLKAEFGWSQRTAYNFINVYQAFPELANFARIDICISALYLLAAPSTPEDIRHHFLDCAIAGEKINYKEIQKAIKEAKQSTSDSKLAAEISARNLDKTGSLKRKDDVVEGELVSLRASPALALGENQERNRSSSSKVLAQAETSSDSEIAASPDLRPGWNSITKRFLLFWGDTASARFIDRLPYEAFVLVISPYQRHQGGILSQSKNVIILHQSDLEEELVKSLLMTFAQREKALIMPSLQDWKTISLALKLGMRIYVGESDLAKCEKVLSKLKF
jgi:hypothetical protein